MTDKFLIIDLSEHVTSHADKKFISNKKSNNYKDKWPEVEEQSAHALNK